MDEGLRVRDEGESREPAPRRHWLRWVLRDLLVPIALVVAGLWGLGQLRAPDLPDQAPDFRLVSLAGPEVRLSSLRGRPVVLNFWATWCGPCELEMPLLTRYAEAHLDVTVLFVAVDGDPQALTAYAEARAMALDSVLRIDDATRTAYSVSTLPTTVVIDSAGAVATSHAGILMPGQLGWMVGD